MTSSIQSKIDLIEYFQKGCKPPSLYHIGTEHEKFIYDSVTFKRPSYEEEKGIRSILQKLQDFGWTYIYEDENPIALEREKAQISLEPGGQLELSGAPLKTVHDTYCEIMLHFKEIKRIEKQLDLIFVGIGVDPLHTREEIPWMPKNRYKLMQTYMPRKGTHGLDMMLRTSTIQVNLDYRSEEDMVKKFRIGLALQPIAQALFANSPIKERHLTGYQSYRGYIWQHTDPDRCGLLDFVFEKDMSFEKYVDYLLKIPMYFVYRDKKYVDALGLSFKDFMQGNLAPLPGEKPTLKDWLDHTTIAFPEVRLKQYLEMRGADSGPCSHISALSAFWVGLLYDDISLDKAYEIISSFTKQERHYLYYTVPIEGIHTPFRGKFLRDFILEILSLSQEGLHRRNCPNKEGKTEAIYLDPLFNILLNNQSLADKLIQEWPILSSQEEQNDFIRTLAY